MLRTVLTTTAIATAMAGTALAQSAADGLDTYADIAEANYRDSVDPAPALQEAANVLIENPSAATMSDDRQAWLEALVPYQQTAVFRFGKLIVDDWEGKVIARPLDEGLVDYVVAGGAAPMEGYDENPAAGLNVIANPTFIVPGSEIDAREITSALLEGALHVAGEAEANVATGYHTIEFLLWGQDLEPYYETAGQRPWTDYASSADCTNGNCDRRADYLRAATELLISDLAYMADAWAKGDEARASVMDDGNGVMRILTGIGSLSYREQAGERVQLGLLPNGPEEEHSCFADNTHHDQFYNALGIRNVYNGQYRGVNGTVTAGPSLRDLLTEADSEVAQAHGAAQSEMTEMKLTAEPGFHYDMMLDPSNEAGGQLIQAAIDGLVAQTREIERAVAALGVESIAFEGSDSLDNPEAVFK